MSSLEEENRREQADYERTRMLGPLALEVCEARAALEDATQVTIVLGREARPLGHSAGDDGHHLNERARKACEELDRCKANYGVALSRYREVYDDPHG